MCRRKKQNRKSPRLFFLYQEAGGGRRESHAPYGGNGAAWGKTIERCVDYMKSENTGLPKSNVLQFVFGENESIIVRPSGTEPNLKIYMELRRGTESVKDYFEKFMNRARLDTFCSC